MGWIHADAEHLVAGDTYSCFSNKNTNEIHSIRRIDEDSIRIWHVDNSIRHLDNGDDVFIYNRQVCIIPECWEHHDEAS